MTPCVIEKPAPADEREQRREERPDVALLAVPERVSLVRCRLPPRRSAMKSSTSVVVSATEWAASESIAAEPESTPGDQPWRPRSRGSRRPRRRRCRRTLVSRLGPSAAAGARPLLVHPTWQRLCARVGVCAHAYATAASVWRVSRTRTERLVNLVICLLSTRRFLTAAQIAATVPGYEHDPEDPRDHEAFQRKFERDKAELRELGVPLETGTASVFDTEPGYRIARRDYALPDIPLEPDEAAAVGIAARLWQHAGLAAAASSGPGQAARRRRRRRPAGHARRGAGGHRRPGVRAADRRRPRPPRGDVRLPGARGRRARAPAGCSRGAWCAGAAGGTWSATTSTAARPAASGSPASSAPCGPPGRPARTQPPADVDLISHVARWSGPVERTGRATVLVRPGRAAGLRRWARGHRAGSGRRPAGAALRRRRRPRRLAGRLRRATCGCSSPPEVREAVIQRLKEIAARPRAAVAAGSRVTPPGRRAGAPRPTGWPGCSTWCRTCWPGPASRSPRRPADLGRDRAAAARGPGAAVGVRAARATAPAT